MPKDKDHNNVIGDIHNHQDDTNHGVKKQETYKPVDQLTPRYRDLFAAMLHEDDNIANEAYDNVLFERKLAVPYLCNQYELAHTKTAQDRKLRYFCIQLLGFSGAKNSQKIVLQALSDEDAHVRKEALYAVEDLKLKSATDHVRNRLQDLDPDVRRVAQEVYDYLLSM